MNDDDGAIYNNQPHRGPGRETGILSTPDYIDWRFTGQGSTGRHSTGWAVGLKLRFITLNTPSRRSTGRESIGLEGFTDLESMKKLCRVCLYRGGILTAGKHP